MKKRDETVKLALSLEQALLCQRRLAEEGIELTVTQAVNVILKQVNKSALCASEAAVDGGTKK
jgi:hypothetical protein